MSMSTFQKLTLATCIVLCVALLLPKMLLSRGKKDAEGGQGRFPPMARQMSPDSQRASGSQLPRAHNTEAIARAKGAGTGAGTGGKSNLAGQIIPIYGFGILVYILYILFKITSKGNCKPTESRLPSIRSENLKRKITDFELSQLQDKLRETEMVMENMVSKANHSPERVKGVSPDQEENLLFQLREITRVMQEGRLVEGVVPEKKAQDDWEDFPAEPQQCWEHSHCPHHHEQQSRPEAEAEAQRTDADGADGADSVGNSPEGEVEESEGLNKDDVAKAAFVTTRDEEEEGPERDLAADNNNDEEENSYYRAGRGAGEIDLGVPEEDLADLGVPEEDLADLGVPEEDLAGVLEELELTLKMTSVKEQEKVEDLARPAGAPTGGTHVRRRNRKKRAKRDSH